MTTTTNPIVQDFDLRRLNIHELAKLTGKERKTIQKKLQGVPYEAGKQSQKRYESKVALEIIYVGATEDAIGATITSAEASRQLTIARKEQIELEMEVTRGDRWPKDDVESIHEASLSNIAGLLKSHEGKPLSAELIRDIFTELREVPAKLTKL
jgi:hypothetical protein